MPASTLIHLALCLEFLVSLLLLLLLLPLLFLLELSDTSSREGCHTHMVHLRERRPEARGLFLYTWNNGMWCDHRKRQCISQQQ